MTPMLELSIGVADGRTYSYSTSDLGSPTLVPVHRPDDLLVWARTLAEACRSRCVVWLHESALEAWGMTLDPGDVTDAERARIAGADANAWSSPGWARVSSDLHVAVPAWSGDLAFGELDDASDVREALVLWRSLVGAAFLYSAPATALYLIDDRELARPRSPAPVAFRQSAFSVPAHVWARPLKEAERAAPYVSLFDRRGAYLAAWRSVELPDGEWRVLNADDTTRVDVRAPGYYLVDVRALAPFLDDAGLPDPFVRHPREEEEPRVWLTSPLAVLAAELAAAAGVVISMHGAVIASRKVRALDRAAERLAGALRELEVRTPGPVVDAVRDAVKDAYKRGTAHLEYGRRAPHPLHRPEWRHTIVDRHVANTFRGLLRGAGRPIIVGGVDSALYAMNDTHAAPEGLRTGPELGAWRWRVSVPLTAERLELLERTPRAVLFDLIEAAASA